MTRTRALALLPVAVLADLLRALADAVDTALADRLNGPEDQ